MTVTSLGRGIYIPIPTFFNQDEELDLVALDQHIAYLSKTGISGLVVLGSMGEGVALTEQERFKVIEQSAKSVSKHNPDLKIIAGTSAQSAKATLHLTEMAAKAGAHFCLVLPPSYYKTAIDDVGIEKFYRQIADTSPLPLVIYNYPGVSQGVDVGVKLVVKLSKHPNIVGLKATDGSVGKMSDLVRKTDPKGK
jgi:L-threo-3-deoxy-hexylosonate aldolase